METTVTLHAIPQWFMFTNTTSKSGRQQRHKIIYNIFRLRLSVGCKNWFRRGKTIDRTPMHNTVPDIWTRVQSLVSRIGWGIAATALDFWNQRGWPCSSEAQVGTVHAWLYTPKSFEERWSHLWTLAQTGYPWYELMQQRSRN